MKDIKFAFVNIKNNFLNAKELKSAFITSVVGMCINNIAFIIIWYYFGTMIGNINGWESFDIFGLYGFSAASFGVVSAFMKGIFNIPNYISSGSLDKYLNTPKNILLKVAVSDIDTSAIGDLLFGIICFIIYAVLSKISLLQFLIIILMFVIASVVFFAFSLICMSLSFYLMDGENVSQGLYGMFVSVSLYHGGAFTGILRVVFVYIIPSLLLGSLPVEIVRTMSFSGICLSIVLALFWLILSIKIFYYSLKKYDSNNFFGFGN